MSVLVLSGGGQGGWGMLGGLSELSDISFDVYIGTSVGGLICTLLCIGFEASELFEILKDVELTNNLSLPMFLKQYGFSNLDCVIKHVKTLIIRKCGFVPSFSQCKQLYDKDLIITGVCLTDRITTYFKWETHPHMNILDALYITCAVPVLFVPIIYLDKVYVDGGLGDDFPINYATHKYGANEIYGIYLENVKFEITCVLTFVLSVVGFLLFNQDKNKLEHIGSTNIHLIRIENNPFELVNIFRNSFDRVAHFTKGKLEASKALRIIKDTLIKDKVKS